MKKILIYFCLFLPVYGEAAICEIADKELCDKAERGDGESQAKIGEMYYLGKGVNPDNKIAKEWLEKSATQNNARGQYLLGGMLLGMYTLGMADVDDYQQGLEWLNKSAELNNVDAMLFLAGYAEGRGDYLLAKKWYGRACDNGSLKGCQNK